MMLGDNIIGILSGKFKNEELDAYVISINFFPISLIFEAHYNINHYEIKIVLFNKFTTGININY